MFRNLRKTIHIWLEILIRIVLVAAFFQLEDAQAFKRKILPDEIWIYRYPNKDSYVPVSVLWPLVTLVPVFVFIVNYIFTRHSKDLKAAILGQTLSLGLNGVLIDLIKITVGRPRPDFFYRCFPDGVMNSEMVCTGNPGAVNDGRKSFPSGHSSFAFTAMGFLSFYLMGKLKIFSEEGRGKSYRLIICFTPMVVALLIAISRTMDYHHWKEDVGVGSIIGLLIAWMCYRQYFPPVACKKSNLCYEMALQTPTDSEEAIEKEIKWI